MKRLLAVTAVAFLFAAAARAAKFEDSFKDGINKYDRRQWSAVVSAMRAAIAANPSESPQKVFIYGTRYVSYTPHFHLGAALIQLGNCREGVAELQISEQQGAITRLPEYGELKALLAKCPAPPPITTTREEEPAKPPVITETAEKPAPFPAPTGTTGTTTTSGGGRKPPLPPVVDDSERRKREDLEIRAARQALDQIVENARKVLASKKTNQTKAESTALVSAIERASRTKGSQSAAELQAMAASVLRSSQQLQAALDKLPIETAVKVDPRLVEAVRAYLRGDYPKVNTVLSRLEQIDEASRGEAALFRAAAKYSMYAMSDRKDDRLKQDAVADLREYKRRVPSGSPDPRLFAPPFRQLADQAR